MSRESHFQSSAIGKFPFFLTPLPQTTNTSTHFHKSQHRSLCIIMKQKVVVQVCSLLLEWQTLSPCFGPNSKFISRQYKWLDEHYQSCFFALTSKFRTKFKLNAFGSPSCHGCNKDVLYVGDYIISKNDYLFK